MATTKLTGFGVLLDEVNSAVSAEIETQIKKATDEFKKEIKELKSYQPTIVIKGKTKTSITGLKHKKSNTLIQVVGLGHNALLVGSAGSGKTKGGEQVAEALKLPFHCISVGSQTSKSDILGYMDANGKYVETEFRKAYENGGVFLMDEIDAGNSNVLIVLNSALANGLCAFPDKMVKQHEDFRFIGTANTYGNGADRQYVGRNQLDSATLDRFTIIDWGVDVELEKLLVKDYTYGEYWHNVILEIREYVERTQIRAIISPRATVKGAQLLGLGFSLEEVLEMCVFGQVPSDKQSKISEIAKQVKMPTTAVAGKAKEKENPLEETEFPF